jgi:hypothetical protein
VRIQGYLIVPEVTISGGGVQARSDVSISRVSLCRRWVRALHSD